MPWSGGVYTRGYPSWTNDASLNLPISATKFDTEDNDFASGLNNCLTKDGLNTPNAAMTWGLGTAQVLALTRGNDGTVFSTARTGGSNNPALTAGVVDATGVNVNLSVGTTLGLQVAGTNVLALIAGQAQMVNGTAAAPSIGFASATGTGLYRFAANSLGFAANGAAAGSIASSGAWSLPAATAAITLNIAGAANQYAAAITANSTSGQSLGLNVLGGTTSADNALLVQNQAGSVNYLQVRGDGQTTVIGTNVSSEALVIKASVDNTGPLATFNSSGATGSYFRYQTNSSDVGYIGAGNRVFSGASTDFAVNVVGAHNLLLGVNGTNTLKLLGTTAPTIQGYGPTTAGLVDMTPDGGTFTFTLTGCTTSPTGTGRWSRNGNQVILVVPSILATSNATTCTLTGLPAAIQPANTQNINMGAGVEDNSAVVTNGGAQVASGSSALTLQKTFGANGGFTSSGTKGVNQPIVVSYLLN